MLMKNQDLHGLALPPGLGTGDRLSRAGSSLGSTSSTSSSLEGWVELGGPKLILNALITIFQHHGARVQLGFVGWGQATVVSTLLSSPPPSSLEEDGEASLEPRRW